MKILSWVIFTLAIFSSFAFAFGLDEFRKEDSDQWTNLFVGALFIKRPVLDLQKRFDDRNDQQLCLDIGRIAYRYDNQIHNEASSILLPEDLQKKVDESSTA